MVCLVGSALSNLLAVVPPVIACLFVGLRKSKAASE